MPVPWVPWDSFFCCFLGLCSAMFIALRSLGFQDIIDVRCEAGCWFNAWGGCVLGVVEKHHIQPAQIFWFRVLTSPPQKKRLCRLKGLPGPQKERLVSESPFFRGYVRFGELGGCLGSSDHHCQAAFFGVIQSYTFIAASGQLGWETSQCTVKNPSGTSNEEWRWASKALNRDWFGVMVWTIGGFRISPPYDAIGPFLWILLEKTKWSNQITWCFCDLPP